MVIEKDLVEQALASVEADLAAGFGEVLGEMHFGRDLHGSTLEQNELFATSDQLVVVPWVLRGTHVGEFLGVPPTYVELELRGTTFVQVAGSGDEADWTYHRYVDYLGALHQMGVTTTSRPALTAEEYAAWSTRRT